MAAKIRINKGFITRFRHKILLIALMGVITALVSVATLHTTSDANAASSQATAPYIVENGVKMVDAWNMPGATWQVWLSRPPGDDTYGANDLFVVSVEFNEDVRVNSNTTFKFHYGFFNWDRQLVHVAQDGNKVFFGTTVGPWEDLDGIFIGDGSKTLGHNDASFITSVATGANADLSHPELGTLSNHKLNGYISRPSILSFDLLRPACGDVYRGGETITIKVRFDQNVRVTGIPQAAVKIKQTEGKMYQRASYAKGSGTNTISLEYEVTESDLDRRGIHIDYNAMLIKRDVGNVPLNRAKITGQRGGLLADLRTDGIYRWRTNAVDGSNRLSLYCPTPLPEALAQVLWSWNGQQESSTKYSVKFTVHQDPGVGDNFDNTIFSAGNLLINNQRFLIGINNTATNARMRAIPTKGAFCASWDSAAGRTATAGENGWTIVPGDVPGSPTATVIPYTWGTGTYTMTVARTQSIGTLSVYKCYIKADGTGTDGNGTLIGSFGFTHDSADPGATINPNFAQTGSSIAHTGHDPIRPIDIPVFEVEVHRPKFEGMRRPKRGVVLYSPLNGIADNARATFNSSAQTITLLAGGETSRPATDGTPIKFTFNSKRR